MVMITKTIISCDDNIFDIKYFIWFENNYININLPKMDFKSLLKQNPITLPANVKFSTKPLSNISRSTSNEINLSLLSQPPLVSSMLPLTATPTQPPLVIPPSTILVSPPTSSKGFLPNNQQDIQLADLLPEYPEQDDKDIQRKLTSLREFSEVAATPIEEAPKRGQYFKHQIANQRFMEHYDRELIFHDTGTGKSCTVFGLTERLRKLYSEGRSRIRKFVIITMNKVLTREAKRQLIYLCSQEGEFDSEVKDSKDKGSVNKQTRKLAAAGYIFVTHIAFANEIHKALTSNNPEDRQNFITKYCNSYFFLDEVDRITPKRLFNLALDDKGLPIEERKSTRTKDEKDDIKTKMYHYKMIWTAFHILPGSKITIGTATPMTNRPQEIAMVMNLILSLDKQMPVAGDLYNNLDPNSREKLEQFAPYFLGKISYVRALDTGLDIVDVGELSGYNIQTGQKMDVRVKVYVPHDYKDPSKVIAIRSYQEQAYTKAIQDEKRTEEGLDDDDKVSGGLRQKTRIAADFVFPPKDGTNEEPLAGNEGFKRWIDQRSTSEEVKNKTRAGSRTIKKTWFVIDPDFTRKLSIGINKGSDGKPSPGDYKTNQYPYITQLSTKYFAIAEIESDCYRNGARINILKDSKTGDIGRLTDDYGNALPGNAFIYSPEIFGSGSFVLGLVLEAYGFSKYDPIAEGPLFGMENGVPVAKKVPKPRYCLFTGNPDITGTKAEEYMLSAMNSPLNANGQYLQIFIVSRVGSVGINVANVVRLHLTGPDWTMASEYQSLSRGIRSTSHLLLVEQQKEYLNKRQQNLEEMSKKYLELLQEYKILESTPAGSSGEQSKIQSLNLLNQQLQFYKASRVRVEIYRHAIYAVGQDSVDISGYVYAEERYRPIKAIERYMKICAWDAQINYKRNVRPTDEPGSSVCDFTTCGYKPYNDSPDQRDLNTQNFNILYADRMIGDIKDQIIDILRQYFEIQIDMLIYTIKYRNKDKGLGDISIMMALEELYSDSVIGKPIIDRYGFKTYLHQDGPRLFLHSSAPGLGQQSFGATSSSSIYTQYLMATVDKSLQDEIKDLGLQRREKIISEIKEQRVVITPQLNISAEDKANILETIIKNYQPSGYNNEYRPTYIVQPPTNILNILDMNRDNIFVLHELPQSYFEQHKPKKHKDPSKKYDIDALDISARQNEVIPNNPTAPLVVIHKIYTLGQESGPGSAARAAKAEGILRIMKLENKNPELNVWREVPINQYPGYNRVLQIVAYRRTLSKAKDWGSSVVQGGKFKILTKLKKIKSSDKRSEYPGRECKDENRDWILLHMYEAGFPVNNQQAIAEAGLLSRAQIINMLTQKKSGFKGDALERLQTYNDNAIRHIYVLNTLYKNKVDMCEDFKNYLASKGEISYI
jgi:hypothetical protein